MPTKRAIAVVGALMVALLLGYVIWNPSGENQGAKSTPTSPHGFDSAQRQNFAVLRGATQPVPRSLQAELRRARNPTVRTLWLDTAKYVQAGDGIWVANGRKDTCIIQAHGGAVSCVRRYILFQKGVALGVAEVGPQIDPKSREFTVYGIVPDQIKAIQVQVGYRKRMVQIRNNSYSLSARVPILIKRFER